MDEKEVEGDIEEKEEEAENEDERKEGEGLERKEELANCSTWVEERNNSWKFGSLELYVSK